MSKNKDNQISHDNVATQILQMIEVISVLRSPSGCPWDREQTHHSLKQGLLEEAFEVLDAIDACDTDFLCEELGDLLFHILIQCEIASETDEFSLVDVISRAHDKLTRRHPHVFGDDSANTTEDAIKLWEDIKRNEPGSKRAVSKDSMMPALIQASRLFGRIDFDPPDSCYPTHNEIDFSPSNSDIESWSEKRKKEYVAHSLMGICDMALRLNIDPESTLREYVSELVRESAIPD